MIDIDNFKSFNDTYGHNVGDDVIREVSRLLVKYFGIDHCYRIGGDEFLIISGCSIYTICSFILFTFYTINSFHLLRVENLYMQNTSNASNISDTGSAITKLFVNPAIMYPTEDAMITGI